MEASKVLLMVFVFFILFIIFLFCLFFKSCMKAFKSGWNSVEDE